jgi:hypothetical protein
VKRGRGGARKDKERAAELVVVRLGSRWPVATRPRQQATPTVVLPATATSGEVRGWETGTEGGPCASEGADVDG